ncbi:hypothetical protein KR222_011332, partial [Zaprionus bogoriensis]
SSAQYYTPYNPYQTPSPTFSSLNNNNYYYTTPYPYYPTANPYYYGTTPSPYDNTKIRIWPYVIGQYLYPTYYNNNYNNPYASWNTPNWQTYYANAYQNNWGKK